MASNLITALQAQIKLDISDVTLKQGDMRRALKQMAQVTREMETPMDKYQKALKSLYIAHGELKYSAEELAKREEHLARKFDITGEYAEAARVEQEKLAAAAKKLADDEKKAAKAADDLAKAMAKQEKAINAAYLASEIAKIEAEEKRVAKAAEDAAKAMAKQEKAVAWAYVNEELAKIEAEEKRVAKAAEDAAKAMAKQEKAIAWAYVREELEKIEAEERRIAKSAEDAAKAMAKQEEDIAWAYVREELAKIEEEEKAITAATERHTKALERAGMGASKYEKEINQLFDDFRKGRIDLKAYTEQLNAIDEHYVDGPARIEAEADAEKQLNQARKVAGKYINEEISASKRYDEVMLALRQLRAAKKLTNDQFERAAIAATNERYAIKKLEPSARQLHYIYKMNEKGLRELNRQRELSNALMQREANSANSLKSAIQGVAGAYLGMMGVRAGLQIASDMSQAKIAFEVMLGSAEEGVAMFEKVRAFAARTPITLEGAQKAAKTMLQFGVTADELMPKMEQIGDIAAGDTERMTGLALAFGQVTAAGRLTGQETLQMVNQGFNPLQQMAEDMAETFGGLAKDYFPMLKKEMEQGNITLELTSLAMESATEEGGRFYKMNEKMSKTMGGAWNKLLGSIQALIGRFSEDLEPVLVKILNHMSQMISWVKYAADEFGGFGGKLLIAAAAGGATIAAITKLISFINLMRKSVIALNVVTVIMHSLSGPRGWAILAAGAVAATAAFTAMTLATKESEEALEKETEAIKKNARYTELLSKLKKRQAAPQAKDLEWMQEQKKSYETQQQLLGLNKEELRVKQKRMFIDEVWSKNILPGYKQELLTLYERNEALKEEAAIKNMLWSREIESAKTEKDLRDLRQKGLLTNIELQEKLFDLEDKRLERIKELAEAGKAIQDKYNPVAMVAEQLAELNVLLATGNITQEQYFAERQDLLRKSIKVDKMSPVEATKRGSQQMVDFLAGQQTDIQQQQLEKQEAQRLLQEAQLRAQEITNRKLGELQPVGVIRK